MKKSLGMTILVLGLVMTVQCRAETNASEVRRTVESRGGVVIWGHEIDHVEYAKLAASVAAGTVVVYFDSLATEMLKKVGKRVPAAMVALTFKNGEASFDGLELQAGIATFNHSKLVVYHEPRVEWRGIRTKVTMHRVEQTIPLPNTHQPYLRLVKR